jgi:hypothetical protein
MFNRRSKLMKQSTPTQQDVETVRVSCPVQSSFPRPSGSEHLYWEIIADNLSKASWSWGLRLSRGFARADNLDC